MAGRGPLPKMQRQRERDTRRRMAEMTIVKPDGEVRGPELPPGYSDEVVEWYETWRRSPMAQLFEETDWTRLRLILAPLIESYLRRPTAAALSEIRLNEERLGATYADRLRARILVEDEAPLAPVAELPPSSRDDVRDRLKGLQ